MRVEESFGDIERHARERHARRSCRRSSAPASRASRARSTASCAGTCSTISIAPPPLSLAATLARLLVADGSLLGFFSTAVERRAGALHQVRRRRTGQPALSHLRRDPGASAQPAEPRHHQAVRDAARLRFVPDEDQHAGDHLPQARVPRRTLTCAAGRRPWTTRMSRPLIALLTDFGTARSLRRHDEGRRCSACAPTRRWSTSPTTSRRTTSGPARRQLAAVLQVLSRRRPCSSSSSIRASARRGAAWPLETGDYRFVAPDNGVLGAVLDETPARSASSSSPSASSRGRRSAARSRAAIASPRPPRGWPRARR